MSIILRHSRDLTGCDQPWVALPGTMCPLAPERRRRSLARALETAFENSRDPWWALSRQMGAEPTGPWSTTLTCSPTMSDFGLLMAWTELIRQMAAEDEPTLVVCDDPWLFRHIEESVGVSAGKRPPLLPAAAKLALRGWAARLALVLRFARAMRATRSQRANHKPGIPVLAVYGHPASKADGTDAYFGPLMVQYPALHRLLHTDCPAGRSAELAADGRTASLHAWGRAAWLPNLLWTRWQPHGDSLTGPWRWLLLRARAKENSTAMAATSRWQMACQKAWLAAIRPRAVAWPWENHSWERDFCRLARAQGARTFGYQHTVVGRHMFNQSPNLVPDGMAAIPDLLLANGPAYRGDLERAGIPPERLAVAGAIRLLAAGRLPFDPQGPVFVALSHDHGLADQQMRAVKQAAAAHPGRVFLVKDHPMYPYSFTDSGTIRRTEVSLQKQPALSAVFVCTGAVGLEGILGGLPTFRLIPEGVIAMDILPAGVKAVNVEAEDFPAALATAGSWQSPDWADVLSPPDFALLARLLIGENAE